MRIIAVLVFGAVLARLPAAESAIPDDCEAGSQAAMRSCLEKKSQASAATLATAERAALAALARWDEDETYRLSATAALKIASKSFVQFRQAHCDFVSSLGGGAIGNALMLRRLACITELNQQQTGSLHRATSDLPKK
jgi:uncharacterized protein YecT (DUF1311 family)